MYCSYKKGKRVDTLREQFKDTLYTISSSVCAGRQMPQAIEDASKECISINGPDADLSRELSAMTNLYYQSHADMSELLINFAKRCEVTEVRQFAEAYRICTDCGGDIESVCLKTSNMLLEKMDFQNEVKALIAEKKLDIVLLSAMPILVLMFLNLTNYSYISVLYETAAGRVVMTFCLALTVIAILWALRITNIKS